ncbi:MAG TPA: ATP-binding protein [Vicinamibacterales bacterium]|nr:ATP-binding protein [Vicinamibacterales bacterium]
MKTVERWWLNLPIRYKGLLVVTLPLIAVGVTLLMRIPFARQEQRTANVLRHAADTRDVTQKLLLSLLEIESGIGGYSLTGDRSFLRRFEQARDSIPEKLDRLAVLLNGGDHQAIYNETSELVYHELSVAADLAAGVVSRDDTRLRERLTEERQVMDQIRDTVGQLERSQDALVEQNQLELNDLRRWITPVMSVTFFGGLLATMIAGWLFATGIATRVTALEGTAERLAVGKALYLEPSLGLDEIGSLDRALRRASDLQHQRERQVEHATAELQRTVHEQALLNRELEAFSYSVSHDLRAPLRSIDGFAQALREDWGDRLDEAGQDSLSRIRNAAQKMGRLIDDLIKLSRLTRGQILRVNVDLSTIGHEVCAELTERNPSRKVEWKIHPGLRCSCDPALVRILLENLIGNAWKFTSKTPDACIEFARMPGPDEPPVFVIRDNGAGFDMKYVDRLFGPFQRLHGDREFPGTGIGLATVQRIVHKHSGSVRTRAEVGKGARFYFTLEPSDTPLRELDA